jgi:hypothetical protein
MPSNDNPRSVAVDAAGAIVVAGESWLETGNDAFLVKYDGDGVEQWKRTHIADGDLNVKPCDVATTSDGSTIVAGTEFLAGETPDAYWLRAFTP